MQNFRRMAMTTAALALVLAGPALAQTLPPQIAVQTAPPPPFAETLAKAQAGDAVAEESVGYAYAMGSADTPRDKYQAMDWFARAAAQGDTYAADRLKDLQDNLAEFQKLKAAAQTGNADAHYAFADFTRDDQFGMLDGHGFETTSAMTWFKLAAAQGQADAETYMGLYYLRAYAYAVDPKSPNYKTSQAPADPDNFATALDWYTRAADQGQTDALHAMPVLYALDTPFHDFTKSEAWLQKVGYGPVVPLPAGIPPGTAAHDAWMKKALSADSALQTLWLMYRGLYFRRSVTEYDHFLTVEIPTTRDENKLFVCLQHMHDRMPGGDPDEDLAEMYQFGRGTKVDEAEATRLYMGLFQSEWRNDIDTQRAKAWMGLMRYGHGDLKTAYFWLSQAYDYTKPEPFNLAHISHPDTDHQFAQAKAAMEVVIARLTPAERAEQDAAVKAWQRTLPPVYIEPRVF